MSASPLARVERLEAAPALPLGSDERFNGYGVMGLPFRSGHVLALRRFPFTTIGAGYTSVWHRMPSGEWTFYSTSVADRACPRYFGALAAAAIETDVVVAWPTPYSLRIEVPAARLDWEVEVAPTRATRLMNAMGGLLPEAAWRVPTVLSAMGAMAGPLLGVGRVGLRGRVPNGQWFIANPRQVWAVTHSRASLAGEDFGAPGPVRPQARLEDFLIPQRGILAIGRAYFEPFDPARHSSRTGEVLRAAAD